MFARKKIEAVAVREGKRALVEVEADALVLTAIDRFNWAVVPPGAIAISGEGQITAFAFVGHCWAM
jgi:hypothetical protein